MLRLFSEKLWVLTLGFLDSVDTSTTMVVQPGPVVEFLLANQNVRDLYSVDWTKVHRLLLCSRISTDVLAYSRSTYLIFTFHQAKRALKNLRVKVAPSNREYKISGLSDYPCKEQMYVVISSIFFSLHVDIALCSSLTYLSLIDTGFL